jgi:hypothetical protein
MSTGRRSVGWRLELVGWMRRSSFAWPEVRSSMRSAKEVALTENRSR